MGSLLSFYRACALFLFVLVGLSLSSQTPSQDGEWSAPIPFGIVPVAVANLPNGELITWSSQSKLTWVPSGSGVTYTQIFDPFTNTTQPETTTQTDHDMFCPGINNLSDGRILSAGGTSSQRTSIYDPVTEVWSAAGDMSVPRGYQGNVTLSDGSVFTIGGSWETGPDGNKDAELWTAETGWVMLPGIKSEDIYTSNDLSKEIQGLYRVDNHVWLWPAPNGELFHAGPGEMMHWIDVDNGGSITDAGLRGSDTYSMKGTTVMFDTGRILKVGGAESYGESDSAPVPAKDNSFVININNPSNVTVTATNNNLAFSRTMHNSTVLPDGKVLVTGGLDHAEVFTDVGSRLTAELFDPQTNAWTSVAGMVTPRTYHSVAILMLDGRVFVGGGGLCDNTNLDECVNHTDAEIYSPPYLFDGTGNLATRPQIASAPATADYNTSIAVTTDVAVSEFSLVRFSAATHSTNNEQRRIPLTTTSGTSHSLAIPDRNLLPPGYYMLFALDANGVPSVAEAIQIGNNIPLNENPSLILDLKFDDASGSTITDDSQYANDATIYDVSNAGATKVQSTDNWGNGLFGGALQTDGTKFQSETIAEVQHTPSMATANRYITVMAWVSRNEIVNNASIFTHDYPNMFFGFHNSLYKWEFDTDQGSKASCYAGYTPVTEWVHIAATYDGQTARLYANGVEICAKNVTGNILFTPTDADPNFTTFSTSGFYERRTPAQIGEPYNDSGVTDELDGRIDELKVYNKPLTQAEIKAFFDLGQGLPNVPACPAGTIVTEYKVGAAGAWVEGNNINASEGAEIYIRAKDYVGEYLLTTAETNGNTFSSTSDFDQSIGYRLDTGTNRGDNDGLIAITDAGQYVLTTAGGCPTALTLKVTGSCDPGDAAIATEFRVNGDWNSVYNGQNDIDLAPGTELVISASPNVNPNTGFNFIITITLPDGTEVGDNYNLGTLSNLHTGAYIITTEEGCSSIVHLTVGDSGCAPGTIIPEYTIDGIPQSGANVVSVDEGQDLVLSVLPDNSGIFITLPSGTVVGDDYTIDGILPSQSGIYSFTSAAGCTTTLDVLVTAGCDPGRIIPEYRLDGVWDSGLNDLNLAVGTEVMFSMLPNNIGVTVTFPDGTIVGDDFNIGAIDESDSGAYTLLSAEGCSTVINLTVGDPGCLLGDILPEYTIDGVTESGTDPITVVEGQEIILSMLPDGIGLTIMLPDGTEVGDNHSLGNVVPSQSGLYTFTSTDGCIETLSIMVNSATCQPGDVIPEYTIDGVTGSGTDPIVINEGQSVILNMLPIGSGQAIELPDGSLVGINHNLGNVVPAQSGVYTFTSIENCVATLEIQVVTTNTCQPGRIIPEYRLDGVWDSGLNDLAVPNGTEVMFSMLPNNIGLTVEFPDGTVVGDDFNIGAVTPANNGSYLLTSSEGCTTIINLLVENQGCLPGSVVPEYTIDGNTQSGAGAITVDEGQSVVLSMLPDGIDLTITLPNGSEVGDNHDLGNMVPAQSGIYTFTSSEGCVETLNITVNAVSCQSGDIIPEYTIDGNTQSGAGAITIDEGQSVVLSMLPDGIGLTITLPNGSEVGDNHDLGNMVPSQSGRYTFTSSEGCMATLEIQVIPVNNCQPGQIIPEYRLDGVWSSGLNNLTVANGTGVMFSMLPNGIPVTVQFPNGNVVGDDFNIGAVTPADNGSYLLTSSEGCTTTINLTVEDQGCQPGEVIPEYTIDGFTQSGTGNITIDEGQLVILSMLPDGVGLTIALPNGSLVGDNYNLGNVVPSQSGTYAFTSDDGCVATLDITVTPASCQPGAIVPEYRLDGIWSSGLNDLNVDEGTEVMFSMLPNNIGVTVEFPDGTIVGDDFNIGAVTPADSGSYVLTSSEGCHTTINLTVASAGRVTTNSRATDSESNGIRAVERFDNGTISMVYPNPTEGIVNINLKGFENQPLVATLYNATGQLVSEKKFSKEHRALEQVNLENLPNGLYRLVLQSALRKQVHSILITK